MSDWMGVAQYKNSDQYRPKPRKAFNSAWKHRLALGEEPLNIVIVQGKHPDSDGRKNPVTGETVNLPFAEYQRHTKMNPFRSFMCTAHLGECLACDKHYNENDESISKPRRTNYFTVVVLEEFAVETNKYGDETWHLLKELVPAEQNRLQQAGADLRFGRKMFLDLGKNHTQNLFTIMKDISEKCHCGGTIFPKAWSCTSCGAEVASFETTNLSKKDYLALGSKEVKCGSCGTPWFPAAVHQCTNCDEPAPVELFDVVLNLVKTGANTASMIRQTSAPIVGAYDFVLPNGQPLWLVESDEWNPLVAEIMESFDFDELFSAELNPDYQKESIF